MAQDKPHKGAGKITLLAKNGRFQENAYTASLRKSYLDGKITTGQFDDLMQNGRGTREARRKYGIGDYFVEFDVTPEVTESGSASYAEISETRGPASVMFYQGSPSRTFSINAKLIARNKQEAAKVVRDIHILKSWRMPETYQGGLNSGNPPILYLEGYGTMFKMIPVVMTDLSIELSSDHDFITNGGTQTASRSFSFAIPSENGTSVETYVHDYEYTSHVPVVTTVTIALKEARAMASPEGGSGIEGLSGFDILKYRTGRLVGW